MIEPKYIWRYHYNSGDTFYLLSELVDLFYLLKEDPHNIKAYNYWLDLSFFKEEEGTLSELYQLACADFLIKL